MPEKVSIDGELLKSYDMGRNSLMTIEACDDCPSGKPEDPAMLEPSLNIEFGSGAEVVGGKPTTQPEQIHYLWWEFHQGGHEVHRGDPDDKGRVESMALDHLRQLSNGSSKGLNIDDVPPALSEVCLSHFGSWSRTLKKARLDLFDPSRKREPTENEVLAWAKEEVQKRRKIPFPHQIAISERWIQHHFGSWNEVLEGAGAWDMLLERLPVSLDSPQRFISRVAELYSSAREVHNYTEATAFAAAVDIACLEEDVAVTEKEIGEFVWRSTQQAVSFRVVHNLVHHLEGKLGLEFSPHTTVSFVERGIRNLGLPRATRAEARKLTEKLDGKRSVLGIQKPVLAADILCVSEALVCSGHSSERIRTRSFECHPNLTAIASACGTSIESVQKSHWRLLMALTEGADKGEALISL